MTMRDATKASMPRAALLFVALALVGGLAGCGDGLLEPTDPNGPDRAVARVEVANGGSQAAAMRAE
jgi:hypothetical protein